MFFIQKFVYFITNMCSSLINLGHKLSFRIFFYFSCEVSKRRLNIHTMRPLIGDFFSSPNTKPCPAIIIKSRKTGNKFNIFFLIRQTHFFVL